jgi:hypothetical protein
LWPKLEFPKSSPNAKVNVTKSLVTSEGSCHKESSYKYEKSAPYGVEEISKVKVFLPQTDGHTGPQIIYA